MLLHENKDRNTFQIIFIGTHLRDRGSPWEAIDSDNSTTYTLQSAQPDHDGHYFCNEPRLIEINTILNVKQPEPVVEEKVEAIASRELPLEEPAEEQEPMMAKADEGHDHDHDHDHVPAVEPAEDEVPEGQGPAEESAPVEEAPAVVPEAAAEGQSAPAEEDAAPVEEVAAVESEPVQEVAVVESAPVEEVAAVESEPVQEVAEVESAPVEEVTAVESAPVEDVAPVESAPVEEVAATEENAPAPEVPAVTEGA